MNRTIILTIVYATFLSSCKNAQEKGNNNRMEPVNVADTVHTVATTANNNVVFAPDTAIDSKLFLRDYNSIEMFFNGKCNLQTIEGKRYSPVVAFHNASGSEYLLAYQYEGDTKNSFSCFEIGNAGEIKDIDRNSFAQTGIKNFTTESGLTLGRSIEDVKRIKGTNYSERSENQETIFTYKIADTKGSDFLMRYNMPGYFLSVTFDKSRKVKKIFFGFEYP